MNHYKNELLAQLYDILRRYPEGLKEYELLKILKTLELPVFAAGNFADTLTLFRAHFMLFHLLYTLRARLYLEEKGDIEIHCLLVRLRPWRQPAHDLPARPDTLGSYYLDLANMEEMKEVEVEEMIQRFWEEYALFHERPARLKLLGLAESASKEEIKRRYRKMALRHHPDQGGDPEDFLKISAAANALLGF